MDLTLAAVVAIALFFDFTNGFHDTANSIATSVSTRALSPRLAVISSAILNFIGAFFFFKVAATVAKGIVNPDVITLKVVLAGLVGERIRALKGERAEAQAALGEVEQVQLVSSAFTEASDLEGLVTNESIAGAGFEPATFGL